MKKSVTAKPPKHLSREAAGWWSKIVNEWDLDAAARLILEIGLEAFDRMRAAQKLTSASVVLKDRFGQFKLNPACTVERDSRAALLSALKQLNLDIEPLKDTIGRPPGSAHP